LTAEQQIGLGYGFNDGLASDSGWGMSLQDPAGPRPGKNSSILVAPAQMVAFGDTYDTPGYSAAMDNAFSGPDKPAGSSKIRHSGKLNYAFADGHAKSVSMQVGTFTGYGTVGRASNPNDMLMWCYDPNAIADYAANGSWGSVGDYPVLAPDETCAKAVADFYVPANFTVIP
jgi:prepilin-type processing-associated H-X9-DG protein